MWIKIAVLWLGFFIAWNLIEDFDATKLRGKRVVITGASAGIGEQIAYHYARFGADVFVTARREKLLQRVVEKCRELGHEDGQYHYMTADMADLRATELVIKESVSKLGGIDILVLNHIIPHNLGYWTGTKQNFTLFHKIIDINFKAYVYLTTHAIPHLDASAGSVIVMSSLAGKVPQPFLTSYTASKFAIQGFFGSLRQELIIRQSNVSITVCVLGLIGTDSAVKQLQQFGRNFVLDFFRPASPADTALDIVKGGLRREWELYSPYLDVRPFTIIRDVIPRSLAAFNRYVMS